mgnify:CR=1 FL=1
MRSRFKKAWLILQIFMVPAWSFSQGEFNNWYFGNDAGVTFNSGIPVYLTDGALLCAGHCVSVSDSSGSFLFSSNSFGVINRNQEVMPEGHHLHGASTSFFQTSFVVQNLESTNLYYLFTTDLGGYGLEYSIINMELDGGLGDIEPGQKCIPLPGMTKAIGAVTGTRHKNNKYAWVVVKISDTNNNNYASFLINSSGLNTIPVLSNSTVPVEFSPCEIKISPDGAHLILTRNATDFFEFCQFNTKTGQVNPLFHFMPSPFSGDSASTVCAEYSIDSKCLYVCIKPANTGPGYLFQYDASLTDSAAFMASESLIGIVPKRCAMQLAPDWKIYCTNYMADSLHVINYPNIQGPGCDLQVNAVYLKNRTCTDGLPQFLQRYKAYIHTEGQCQGDSIHFSGDIWPPADSIRWNFGDPGSWSNNYSTLSTPVHFYSVPGVYTVELYVRHIDNRTDTSWQTITIVESPQPALGSDTYICYGGSITLDAGFCSGCTYQWDNLSTAQLNIGNNQTYTATDTGMYMVQVTNPSGCTGCDTVHVAISPVPALTTSPLTKPICSGDSTNIVLSSNVPAAVFSWTASLTSGNITGFSADSGTIINQILTNHLATPGEVTYSIVPKVGSCIGDTSHYTVTVNQGDSVDVTVAASTNNICAGAPVTFMATPVNGGASPQYQWQVNGINTGTNNPDFTYTPANGDLVTCILTSSKTVCISNNPATSNAIAMAVNPNLPVSVSVSATTDTVCEGTPVTFTATPVNGGVSPIYQWQVNGINLVLNSPDFTYTPSNGDIVICILTSSEICTANNPANSIPFTVTVKPYLPVSITVTPSENPFCPGSSVTFTTTTTNGGVSPHYQWQVNGSNVGLSSPGFTYTPANGDLVTCILTSSELCTTNNPAAGNVIIMQENTSLPAGVAITATPNPFCPGASVTFSASPVNGGTAPFYQWKVNGNNAGTNANVFTCTPSNNDSISCLLTSNLACVSNNPVYSNRIVMNAAAVPVVSFTPCFDTITTTNAKPIKLKGGIPLGGTYSGAGVTGNVYYPSVVGTGTHIITYSYTNTALCSATASLTIHQMASSSIPCGQPFTDIRDGAVYQTISLGSQCWMAEDLHFGNSISTSLHQSDNCRPEKYTHPESVYQWDELMSYDPTPASQGLCPPGWHVPTEADWNALFANWTNSGFAGSPLKYSGFSGFDGILSGVRHHTVQWDYAGFAVFFWSSTAHGPYKAWAHGLNETDPSVSAYPAARSNAFSVRCVRD